MYDSKIIVILQKSNISALKGINTLSTQFLYFNSLLY